MRHALVRIIIIATFIWLTEGVTLYIFLVILVLLSRQRVGEKISQGNSWAFMSCWCFLCRICRFA